MARLAGPFHQARQGRGLLIELVAGDYACSNILRRFDGDGLRTRRMLGKRSVKKSGSSSVSFRFVLSRQASYRIAFNHALPRMTRKARIARGSVALRAPPSRGPTGRLELPPPLRVLSASFPPWSPMLPNPTRPVGGLVLSAGSEFASVTDESSPDTRTTGRTKIPIYAQVLTDEPLDWFYDLTRLFRDHPGEVKGKVVVELFESLPAEIRRRIWTGLRRVRIHLTDPRPYLEDRDGLFIEVTGKPFPVDELRHRSSRGDTVARYLLANGDEFVARSILLDSPPFRLAAKIVSVDEAHGMVWHDHDFAKPLGLDLDEQLVAIRTKGQSLVTRAAEFASKSGSVFAEADHSVLDVKLDAMMLSPFGALARAVHAHVARQLREKHAYDEGDEKLLRRVEAIRDQLGSRIQRLADPFSGAEPFESGSSLIGVSVAFAEPLASIQSHEVIEGQAGDVAARMAATLFEREGLAGVVKRFDFVTFNGERATENNVGEVLRRSAALRN